MLYAARCGKFESQFYIKLRQYCTDYTTQKDNPFYEN